MNTTPQHYEPKIREAHWQQQWEASGIYAFRDDKPKAETFVIDTPPPTVSGVLHMGHIFSYTQADFIARYKRMRGFDVFYPMGFDDNGLPTERLVEKVRGVRAIAMSGEENGREKFANLCREVVADAELEFKKLFQSVALSVDWNQLYQTVSDEVTALSQASFLDLIAKGEAYRDFRPTYWDWVDQTAIASAEIEEKELQGVQITIPYGIMDASEWENGARPTFESLEKVQVMTTRPELLGACVALMAHPDDKAKFENKLAVSPLFNVVLPICFDEKVDKEKGTGFVMCCSWGDDTDKEWIAKHNLGWRPILSKEGRIQFGFEKKAEEIIAITFSNARDNRLSITYKNCLNLEAAHTAFYALLGSKLIRDVKNENSAKGKVIKLLEEAGLLLPQGEKQEKIITKTQMVKCAERSGSAIEIIPTSQWFVKICDKKQALLARGAECEWKPDYMQIRLNQWIEGLKEDWCISRQRFFGVPFPVWYVSKEEVGKSGSQEVETVYARFEDLPIDPFVNMPDGYERIETLAGGQVRARKNGEAYIITADKDVMDTWATSSISPQINARVLTQPSPKGRGFSAERFSKLFPADLRPQAHEIIRTWAFYTIVKAHLHSHSIPWKTLMISGWCLASDKTKMSKSKGNVVTPVALIEDKGADAVRYWASTSRLGADTAFSEDLLKIGKKLVNKLWNASSFVGTVLDASGSRLQALGNNTEAQNLKPEALDAWIISRLHQTVATATEAFERFEYADARASIEQFFWRDFCDNYLELVKARAYGAESPEAQESARTTLYACLNTILKLFAPIVPHITEELFARHFAEEFARSGSIHGRNMWPDADNFAYDEESVASGEACLELLEAVRKAKSEANVSIKYPVETLILSCATPACYEAMLQPILSDLKAAGTINHIVFSATAPEGSSLTAAGNFHVQVTLAAQAA